MSRKWRGAVIAALLIAMSTGGAWYVVAATPQYSLYELGRAVQAHDLETAGIYIDIDRVSDGVADSAVDFLREEQRAPASSTGNAWEELGRQFAQGMAELLIPAVRNTIRETVRGQLREAIEKGESGTRFLSVPTTMGEIRTEASVARQGRRAVVTVTQGGRVRTKFIMTQQRDRRWRITGLDKEWLRTLFKESNPLAAVPTPEATARENEQKRLAAETREKEEALVAELHKRLVVTVYEKGYRDKDIYAGQYDAFITIGVAMQNTGTKAIRAFRGTLVFKDLFGTEIYSSTLSNDQELAPGQKRQAEYTIKYNQFIDEQVRLMNTTLSNMTLEWRPKTILFVDGTKLGE